MSKTNNIAAVKTVAEFDEALKSNINIIFMLAPNILTLEKDIKKGHDADKKIFIHIDLAEGIGKDKAGIEFVKKMGVDGIISTRTNVIKIAHELEIFTVQRFFTVDSHSIDTTLEALKASRADMIEIMPGIAVKAIAMLKKKTDTPIIAGGLIDSKEEAQNAVKYGASAISTSNKELWK